MSITKIVITGGPCAGKTSAVERVRAVFSAKGYTVLTVAETATQLISGGVAPWTCATSLDYQKCQVRMQLAKERVFEQAAETMPGEKILIICDRGALDTKCYVSPEDYTLVLDSLGEEENQLRAGYDAVFHLVTAADGAGEHYSLSNNRTRIETPEEAIELDRRLTGCWNEHPHYRVIDNSTDFEGKLQRLVGEICDFLGERPPLEIERKYLIELPDEEWLEAACEGRRTEITQTYLVSADGGEARVRKRGSEDKYVYYHTVKYKGSALARTEIEREISAAEYEELLRQADPDCRPLRKTRYCLDHDGHCFEIDVYPFMSGQATMEVELSGEEEAFSLPGEITVIREITGEREYSSRYMAAHRC